MDDPILIMTLVTASFYGIYLIIKTAKERTREERMLIEKQEENLIEKYNQRILRYNQLIRENEALKNYYEQTVLSLDSYIQQKCEAYPHMAAIMADLLTEHYDQSAKYLENKKRPAIAEAKRIRDLKKETRQILQEKKELEYKLEYIRELFPNIDEIFDSGFNEEESFELETEETTDRVRLFLSPEEYGKLSSAEKNQLALDRYIENRKSKWQIGRDYEMYIGYLYESKGYRVQYTGIIRKLEDMGRDLIVTNGINTFIIQCKRWAKEKTIHEKHIFQLFGTVTLYNIDHPDHPAEGIFVSTTNLSKKAEQIAKELKIHVSHKEIGEFPRIKCNMGKSLSGYPEKIYHLPFDQQYDHVVIDPSKGEFYAMTVKEAEDAGFRRANKWLGDNQ